jgi:hypothetical protein
MSVTLFRLRHVRGTCGGRWYTQELFDIQAFVPHWYQGFYPNVEEIGV